VFQRAIIKHSKGISSQFLHSRKQHVPIKNIRSFTRQIMQSFSELSDLENKCLLRFPSFLDFFLRAKLHKGLISTEESDITPTSAIQMEIIRQSNLLREFFTLFCSSIRACFFFNRHFLGKVPLLLMASPSQGLAFEVITSDIVRSISQITYSNSQSTTNSN
jgi:hypothetical protein